jgi:hypothetical protein
MTVPLLLPSPLIREQIASARHADAHFFPAMVSLSIFIITVALGFSAAFFYENKVIFLAGLIFSIVDSSIIYFILKKHTGRRASPNRDRVLSNFAPYIKQLTSAGFDAAADNSLALIRLGFHLEESRKEVFPVIDEGLRFYLTRLIQIANARQRLGDNEQLNSQFSELQDSLIHQMRQTQSGKTPSPEQTKKLDTQVNGIQGKLDRIETLNRVALQLTNDLSKLRNASEELMNQSLPPQQIQQRGALILAEQLEREKRMTPELQRLNLQ